MNSGVRWHRASEMFDGESVWNAVRERDRKDVFDDVVFYLAKREKERDKELRTQNRKFMLSVLNSMPDITYRTAWIEVILITKDYLFTRSWSHIGQAFKLRRWH